MKRINTKVFTFFLFLLSTISQVNASGAKLPSIETIGDSSTTTPPPTSPTSETPATVPVPVPNSGEGPSSSSSNVYTDQIKTLAGESACATTSWAGRGKAPIGYIKGVALSYGRSLCRLKKNTGLSSIMSAAPSGSESKDALAYYRSIFQSLSISISVPGKDSLRALYTLGIGLGMRESSGSYCEGWDRSAGANRSSSAAEAGVFQTSYDSMAVSPELGKLYSEYKANPNRCFLETFKLGVSCSSSSILGSGAGAEYQAFNISCPAFATEYAMTMLRIQRGHYGPINRKEAQVIKACNQMLKSVQDLIDNDPYACQDII